MRCVINVGLYNHVTWEKPVSLLLSVYNHCPKEVLLMPSVPCSLSLPSVTLKFLLLSDHKTQTSRKRYAPTWDNLSYVPTWDNLSYQWNMPIIKSNDFWWEMGKEVSIGTTVVPIILAIRKTVDRTIPGWRENSNWFLQSICYTRL